jgi:hypothetical protein
LITTNGRELFRVIKDKTNAFLSTGSPKYWPTNAHKIPDLLDFPITNDISTTCAEIMSSYDLTSDHSSILVSVSATVWYRRGPPRLHNSKTNWDAYREILQDRTNFSVGLQDGTDIDRETSNLIHVLQPTAKESTSNCCRHASSIYINISISTEIKN